MTTIVCNTDSMASDSKVVDGDAYYPGQKIYQLCGCLVGIAGEGRAMSQFLRWFEEGQPEAIPELSKRDGSVRALVLTPDHKIYTYDESFFKEPVYREYHAIGTGAHGALVAIKYGASPREAVEAACEVDNNSGLCDLPPPIFYIADVPKPTRRKRRAA